MIIQSIQQIVDRVRDGYEILVRKQVHDPVTLKTFYECITYTRQGNLDSYQDRGQKIDIKS